MGFRRGLGRKAAQRTVVGGYAFHSKSEAYDYQGLLLCEKAGKISGLRLQQPFPCVVNGMLVCTYIADFTYYDEGQQYIHESKGFFEPHSKIKMKLVRALYPGWKIRFTGDKYEFDKRGQIRKTKRGRGIR